MNGITHFLVGIIITVVVWHFFSDQWAARREWAKRTVFSIKNHPISVASLLRVSLTCVVVLFSHAIVDGFAIFTYHPYEELEHLVFFNVISKILFLVTAGVLAIFAIRKDFRYAWGIVFSVAFDLWDFSTLDVIMHYNPSLDFSPLYLHHFEWAFIATFLFWAPNFYQVPLATIVEILIIISLLGIWYVLIKKSPLPENPAIRPSMLVFITACAAFGLWLALPSII